MLDSPGHNSQTLCEACQSPDALDEIRLQTQKAVGGGLIAKIVAKLGLTVELAEMLAKLTDKTIHDLGGVEAVKILAGNLYDQFVGVIDLPWVPEFFEARFVDPFLKSLLLKIIDDIHDQVHGGS